MQLHAKSPCVSKSHKRTLSVQLTSKISPFLDASHAHLQPHLALVHVCPQQVNGHPGDAQNTSTIHSELRRALDRDQRWRWKALVPLARLFASDFGSARSCLSIVEPPPSRPPRLLNERTACALLGPVFSNSSYVRHATTFLTHQTTMRPTMGKSGSVRAPCVCVCVCVCVRVCSQQRSPIVAFERPLCLPYSHRCCLCNAHHYHAHDLCPVTGKSVLTHGRTVCSGINRR